MSKADDQEREFEASLDRARRGITDAPMRPNFDPKLHSDVVADAVKGRKIADYKQALEALGFRYVQAHQLAPYPTGRPHEHGEWRCNQLRLAWTDQEILTFFKTPQELVEYVNKYQLKRRAARSGILLR